MKRSIVLAVMTLILAGCGYEKDLPTETSNAQIKQTELDSVAHNLEVRVTAADGKLKVVD